MMSEDHRLLLFAVCEKSGLPVRLIRHQESMSAGHKQRLLPQGVAVQKTLTMQVGIERDLYLVSGLTDFVLARPVWRGILRQLGYARQYMNMTLNPPQFTALDLTGLPAGMVSPFLPPVGKFPPTLLQGLVLLHDPQVVRDYPLTAISLSLGQSLLVATGEVIPLVYSYAAAAKFYPRLPIWIMEMNEGVGQQTNVETETREKDGHAALFPVGGPVESSHSAEGRMLV